MIEDTGKDQGVKTLQKYNSNEVCVLSFNECH